MKNYYFTFGSNHITTDGVAMENYWVRVVATDYGIARNIFVEQFTKVRMSAPDKFAFQYDDTDFKPHYFPRGEYEVFYE